MKKSLFYPFAFAVMLCIPSLQAEMRTWTDTQGRTIQADLADKDGTSATVKLPNGKTAVIKLDTLSQADRDYVTVWEAPTAGDKAEEAADEVKKLKFKWYRSEKEVFRTAKEANMPVVLLFTGTSWCPYCVKLESEVLSKSKFKTGMNGVALGLMCVAERGGKYKTAWAEQLARQYKSHGSGVPRMIIVSPDGTFLGKISGFQAALGPEGYVDEIRKIAGLPPSTAK